MLDEIQDKISQGILDAVYTIQAVNANTFTVVSLIKTYLHLQKSSCLPFDAPSSYCY